MPPRYRQQSFGYAIFIITDDLVRRPRVVYGKGIKIGEYLGKLLAIDPPLLPRRGPKLGEPLVDRTVDRSSHRLAGAPGELANLLFGFGVLDKDAHASHPIYIVDSCYIYRLPGASGLRLPPFPGNRAKSDVTAAEAVRPADAIHCLIGARLRVGHRPAERRDAEHAAAIGDDPPILGSRSGVEDFDPFQRGRHIEA